jgi:hypothetical protein
MLPNVTLRLLRAQARPASAQVAGALAADEADGHAQALYPLTVG